MSEQDEEMGWGSLILLLVMAVISLILEALFLLGLPDGEEREGD